MDKEKRNIPLNIVQSRKLVRTLAVNDFKTQYAGSYLGIIWAFIQPVITTLVYWFVFQIGLKSGQNMAYPFVLWLMAGLVPWFYFSEALGSGTGSLVQYDYLVKKVVFNIEILPFVKIVSAFFVHLVFIIFVMIMCALYGYYPTLYSLQIIYYIICTIALLFGLIYLTSSVVVFFRDLRQMINIMLQIGIWVTPIMWETDRVLADYPWIVKILKLNPVFYIVTGYRDALLDHRWFWENPVWTAYFWIFTIIMYFIGTGTFRRLREHFADIL